MHVRGTVSNMLSVSLRDPFKRLPTTIELREIAKRLVVAYPMLNDPVSGHVSKPPKSSTSNDLYLNVQAS